MTDLQVLVPSRGRPESIERLARTCALTCTADTRLHFGFDQDDPKLEANIKAAAGHRYTIRPRMGLAAWTNELAMRHIERDDAQALASIGDDHVPVTHGWDTMLLERLPPGGGITYPDDQRRSDIPEAAVISAAVVRALGWMAHPSMHHWFIDKVWADLGRMAGCLVYCRDVLVRHEHPTLPRYRGRHDQTYADAAVYLDADFAAYQRWRLARDGMRADVGKVRRACSLQPA